MTSGPRKKDRPFLELGRMLENWRSSRYRSALAMFKDTESAEAAKKFSFSYRAYSDFEGGVSLPSIETVCELGRFFEKPAEELLTAALLWAQAQMPTPELRESFARISSQRAAARPAHESPALKTIAPVTAPVFENTWVFGLAERKLFEEVPWIGEIFGALLASYPDEAPFAELSHPARDATPLRLTKLLRPAIEAGYILSSATGLKLKHPFIHVPETAEWHTVRSNNVRHAMETILKTIAPEALAQNRAHRQLIVRKLSRKQATEWIQQLKQLEERLENSEPGAPPTQTYALAVAFGPRESSGEPRTK